MRKRTLLLLLAFAALMQHAYYAKRAVNIKWPKNLWEDIYGPKVYIGVPDMAVSGCADGQTTIEGTGLSMTLPDGFEENVSFNGFCRDADSGISVEKLPESFYENREKLTAYINGPDASRPGKRILYQKRFRFNDYDAMLVCVADQTKQRSMIYMAFGDATFNVNMRGTCMTDDAATLNQILYSFLTTCCHAPNA